MKLTVRENRLELEPETALENDMIKRWRQTGTARIGGGSTSLTTAPWSNSLQDTFRLTVEFQDRPPMPAGAIWDETIRRIESCIEAGSKHRERHDAELQKLRDIVGAMMPLGGQQLNERVAAIEARLRAIRAVFGEPL